MGMNVCITALSDLDPVKVFNRVGFEVGPLPVSGRKA